MTREKLSQIKIFMRYKHYTIFFKIGLLRNVSQSNGTSSSFKIKCNYSLFNVLYESIKVLIDVDFNHCQTSIITNQEILQIHLCRPLLHLTFFKFSILHNNFIIQKMNDKIK